MSSRRYGSNLLYTVSSTSSIGRAAIHRARAGVGTSVSLPRRRTETRARGWRRTPRDRRKHVTAAVATCAAVGSDSSSSRRLLVSQQHRHNVGLRCKESTNYSLLVLTRKKNTRTQRNAAAKAQKQASSRQSRRRPQKSALLLFLVFCFDLLAEYNNSAVLLNVFFSCVCLR